MSTEEVFERPIVLRLKKARHILAAGLSLILFAAALWVLRRELAGTHIHDILARLASVGPSSLGLALAFTAASYLALTGYDLLALRYLGRSLPYRRVALTSFIATAVGHNLGVAMLSGGAVRWRMYTASGLSAAEVAAVVAMVGLTFGIGVTFVAASSLVLIPDQAALLLGVPRDVSRGVGLAVVAVLGGYLVIGALRRLPLRLGDWQIRMPRPATTMAQIALASMDLACAGAALYTIIPAEVAPPFALFLGVYVLAIVAGIAAHVPGGIGVFETVLILGLPSLPKDALLAAILVYRVVYYLLPLGIAALLAAVHELRIYRHHIARGLELAQDALEGITPQVMAVAAFVAGVVLLFSGATPGSSDRILELRGWLPLALLELSHLSSSLIGLGLTVLAGALYQRVNAAYHLALLLLVGGVLASLLKGLDWEEALISGLAAFVLWAGRGAFYRKASLQKQRFSPGWAMAVVLAVGGTLWLGLFTYRHVEYGHDLWWQFAFDADASRFLRSTLITITLLTVLALWRLLRPAPPPPARPDVAAVQRAAALVARSPATDAALALVGDKRILFDDEGMGFLMFQIRGRSWISMGDPVGPTEVADALAWRFRELCDLYGGRPVFYQVDAEHLPLYLDLGLSPLKIGEEAIVDLAGFSLQGAARAGLRQSHRRIAKLGLQFEVIEPEALDDARMAELKAVSDAWLEAKNTREKGFSVGRFDPVYLRHFPCALVRQDGRVLAFSNLWPGADHAELSVDLMRHTPACPNGVMDYLFVELMLWGAKHGYRRFNLGMAPLSGLEKGPLAPLWHRVGTLIFRHGEQFYNFEGLRAYKQKFRPQWRPKYLAVPPGLSLPAVLMDVAALIAGGMRGIVAR